MHEAGIAVAVAAEIRDRGLDPARVRVRVRGGHGDPAAFEAAFRAQLELAAPTLGLDRVTILRLPTDRLCIHCAGSFSAIDPDALCPVCGGPGLAVDVHESIELEWEDGPAGGGPEGPALGDPRHSTPAALDTDAVTMRRPLSSSRT
jgi:Zn finger protein HypA/HybF involved in hydrogenase expression